MPTGYTEKIVTGEQSQRDFMLKCASAFFIEFRDEYDLTMEELIDRIQSTPPRVSKADEINAKYDAIKAEIEAKSDADLEKEAKAHNDKEKQRAKDYQTTGLEVNKRVREMKAKISAWDAPALLDPYKEFMLNQLQVTLEWDGSTDFADRWLAELESETITAEKKREQELKSNEDDREYALKKDAQEVEKDQNYRAWMKALLESLPAE